MKLNSFWIKLILILIILISFGIIAWSRIHKNISTLNDKLELPLAAKYIPNGTYLSFYSDTIPTKIPQILEQDKRKINFKEFNDFIDGLFAITTINYTKYLSKWENTDISISIFEPSKLIEKNGWLLTLGGEQNLDQQTFLNEYLEEQNKNGNQVRIESYKDKNIFSITKEDKLFGEKAIASILLDDEILLISSKKDLIKLAIDTSINYENSQFKNKNLREELKNLDNGLALITANKEAMKTLFGFPNTLTEGINDKLLLASLAYKNGALSLDSTIQLEEDSNNQILDEESRKVNVDEINLKEQKEFNSIKKKQERKIISNSDIYYDFLKVLTMDQLSDDIFKILINSENISFVLLKDKSDWLIESINNDQLSDIQSKIKTNGFIKSDISYQDKLLTVWSKINIAKLELGDELISKVGTILYQDKYESLWGNQLSILEQRNKIRIIDSQENDIEQLSHAKQIYMKGFSAYKALNDWKPWQLLKTVNASYYNPNIPGLEITIGSPINNEESKLKIRGKIYID